MQQVGSLVKIYNISISDGDLFLFLTIFMWEAKRVAPSEVVPDFSNGMTISYYYNFQISVIFPKYLLLLIHSTCKNNAQLTSIVSYDTMAAMAQRPPSPRSCWITTRTRGVAAKRISASSWGQYASFRRSGHEKSTSYHFKNSPFVQGHAEPLHIEE